MANLKLKHGETNYLLEESVTPSEVSDQANVAAYQRKALQLVGAGKAVIELSLDGTNWAPAAGTDDEENTPGQMTAGNIFQLPRCVKYVRATKSDDEAAVTVIVLVEGYDAV